MIQLALAKLLTVKAAAIIGGVTLTGGVAVAASTGVIPNPLRGTQPPVATPAASTPGAALTTPAAPAAAAIFGLCTAYLAEADARLLDTPAYADLVADAGGKENVEAYCTVVAANPPGAGPQTTTPPATTPTGKTPGVPTPGSATPTPSHPTGAPTPTPTHPNAPYATPTRPTR